MRSAADFDAFYANTDPWLLSSARFRDRVLRKWLPELIKDRVVLELGCGEGHLTDNIFRSAKSVTGIDISHVAIVRARTRNIPNAQFDTGDLLEASFKDYDVIAALECIYYLRPEEQNVFFEKVAREHRGKMLVLSGPIVGQGKHRRYFSHDDLVKTFKLIGATFSFHNIIIDRRGVFTTLAAAAARLPFCLWILDLIPERYILQRLYIIRMM